MKNYFTMSRQQFWIATIVSLCVIAVAVCYGWMTWSTNDVGESQANPDNGILSEEDLQVDVNPRGLEEEDRQIAQVSTTPNDGSTETQAEAEKSVSATGEIVLSPADFLMPAEGEIFREYNTSELTYFPTLNQYMVHKGIDILAPAGTEVKAAAEGLVSRVFTDRAMGKTIWIAHKGEITIVYSNLDDSVCVEEGDTVTKGQIIAKSGNTSLYEMSDEPHIHVEVLVNGIQADPADYLAKR